MVKKLLLSVLFCLSAVNAQAQVINVDFGGDPAFPVSGWNIIGGVASITNGSLLSNLVDSANTATCVDVRLVDAFILNRSGSAGTSASTAFSPANANATNDNCYIYENDADHTAVIRVEALNPSHKYKFGFFDSYMSDNDARRKCKYTIGSESVTLVPNYNINTVAYISNVSPDANGCVLITLGFGADASVPDKVCGLAVMTIEGDFTPQPIINVDFGGNQASYPVSGWNVVTGITAITNDSLVSNLVDSHNNSTHVSVRMVDAFSSSNIRNGDGQTTASTAFSPTYPPATSDNFYIYEGDADHSVKIQVEGLNPTHLYKFGFFDSYMSDNDARRKCKYVIGSRSVTLVPNYNINNIAYISGVAPDANGYVVIDLAFGADVSVPDKVCGLAVMTIEGDFTPQPIINVDFGGDPAFPVAGWNIIGGAASITNGSVLANLADSQGNMTPVDIRLVDAFNAGRSGSAGTWESTAFSPVSASATNDNCYIYENDTDHSALIQVEGLNPDKLYKFGFFDSYMSDNDVRRKCKYIIGSRYVTLVPNYNVNNVAYIGGVVPDANGNVQIRLGFGADASVADKVCGLAVMTIEGDFTPQPIINIDFGSDPNVVTAGWNNIGGAKPRTQGFLLENMIDSTDAATTVDLRMVDAFSVNPVRNSNGGTTTSTAFWPINANATKYNYYIYENDVDHSAKIQIESLNPNRQYRFGFFDSYMADNDVRRKCKYIIGNRSVTLVPNYNTDNVAYISGVYPDFNGRVLVELDFGADPGIADKVCGLAVMTIEGSDFNYVPAEPSICGDYGTQYFATDLNKDCRTDFKDYAIFAKHYIWDLCLPPDWCEFADIDQSTEVNIGDIADIARQWLWCTDPAQTYCDQFWK